jgi:hypothetical protein
MTTVTNLRQLIIKHFNPSLRTYQEFESELLANEFLKTVFNPAKKTTAPKKTARVTKVAGEKKPRKKSTYNNFFSKEYSTIKEKVTLENPGASGKDITQLTVKAIGSAWTSMSDLEKAKYALPKDDSSSHSSDKDEDLDELD